MNSHSLTPKQQATALKAVRGMSEYDPSTYYASYDAGPYCLFCGKRIAITCVATMSSTGHAYDCPWMLARNLVYEMNEEIDDAVED